MLLINLSSNNEMEAAAAYGFRILRFEVRCKKILVKEWNEWKKIRYEKGINEFSVMEMPPPKRISV